MENPDMRRKASDVIRELEIRVAQLEKEAFLGMDLSFGLMDKAKSSVSDFVSKLPYLREIKSVFKRSFKARNLKQAKKEAKRIMEYGDGNRRAQNYLDYVMESERSAKGRIGLVLTHIKNPNSIPTFGKRAGDGQEAAKLAYGMILLWALCKIIMAIATKFGVVAILMKVVLIGFAAIAVFALGLVILIMLDKPVAKEKTASLKQRYASLVEACIYEELMTRG